jgi:hypothetical protein
VRAEASFVSYNDDKEDVNDNIAKLEEQQLAKQSTIEYALNFIHNVKQLWIDGDPGPLGLYGNCN